MTAPRPIKLLLGVGAFAWAKVPGGGAGARDDRRLMVVSITWMYAGAGFMGLFQRFVLHTPGFPVAAAAIALVFTGLLLLFGRRVPRSALVALGPVGVALIAYTLACMRGYGDSAVLYVWPVLWTAAFFGRWATATVLAALGAAHAFALTSFLAGGSYPTRWLDVMVSMTLVAVVVHALADRNARLLVGFANQARIDPLTGLLNRRGLQERAAAELARAQREQIPVSVVVLDIDHFKQINDEHGHETGDRVLELIGSVLRDQVRGSDIAARIGGEEFVMVLPGCNEQRAVAAAERVRSQTSAIAISGLPKVTLSAGVALVAKRLDLDDVTAEADRALYQAKREGRNRTILASHEGYAESCGASPRDGVRGRSDPEPYAALR